MWQLILPKSIFKFPLNYGKIDAVIDSGQWPQVLLKGGRFAVLYETVRLKRENRNSRKKEAII